MSRKCVIYGVAAALLLGAAPAFAQDVPAQSAPPQPRYATMIAPGDDDALVDWHLGHVASALLVALAARKGG